MPTERLRLFVRLIMLLIFAIIGVYVVYSNYPLYGVTINLEEKYISDLVPGARVKKVLASNTEVNKQVEDAIYFTTESDGYDSAIVKLTFLNGSPDQEIYLGFKDRAEWHYKTKPLFLPLLENLDWYKTNIEPPVFYQKIKKYISFEDFLKKPPETEVVGSYFLENSYARESLEGYKPSEKPTKINVPLRGTHTFYTYLQHEPFSIKVEKQDLNWYEGEDILKIRVSKDGKVLTEKNIGDDGIVDTSQLLGEVKSEEIKYEGGYPENGLYKIDLIASGDVVIKTIESSFQLYSFVPPLYPISGSSVYKPDIASGSATLIYTDANNLVFRTQHSTSYQDIKVNDSVIGINQVNTDFPYKSDKNRNVLSIPDGDVVLRGAGYFSFSKEQFFTPFLFKKQEVKNKADLELIDYLLTDYVRPFNVDAGWKETEIIFDLKSAFYDNKGKLSWIIRAPRLKENGNSILIKNIEVELTKDPLLE